MGLKVIVPRSHFVLLSAWDLDLLLKDQYLLTSSASVSDPSSDTLSPPGEGRDLCRHDDSHLAGRVRCRGERTDGDDEGDETVSATVAPPCELVQLNI